LQHYGIHILNLITTLIQHCGICKWIPEKKILNLNG
jgi:hypothetical protein